MTHSFPTRRSFGVVASRPSDSPIAPAPFVPVPPSCRCTLASLCERIAMTSADLLASDFATLPDLIRAHAQERPDAVAAADPFRRLTWSDLDRMIDRIAARLQRDGFAKGDRTAFAGLNSAHQREIGKASGRERRGQCVEHPGGT